MLYSCIQSVKDDFPARNEEVSGLCSRQDYWVYHCGGVVDMGGTLGIYVEICPVWQLNACMRMPMIETLPLRPPFKHTLVAGGWVSQVSDINQCSGPPSDEYFELFLPLETK